MENVCWKEFGLLSFVWIAFLVLQIGKVFISYRFGFVPMYSVNLLTHWRCMFEIELHIYLLGMVLGGELVAGSYLVISNYVEANV